MTNHVCRTGEKVLKSEYTFEVSFIIGPTFLSRTYSVTYSIISKGV